MGISIFSIAFHKRKPKKNIRIQNCITIPRNQINCIEQSAIMCNVANIVD